jgi:hypothetical protein
METGRMGRGDGRIEKTQGRISVDRGSKPTLPLTIPRRLFKSSTKDSTHDRDRHIGGSSMKALSNKPDCHQRQMPCVALGKTNNIHFA